MMVLFFADKCRVVIHTANYIQRDWKKTQGVWMHDFPLKANAADVRADDPPTARFEKDFRAYFTAMHSLDVRD